MQPIDADRNKKQGREGQDTQDDLNQSQCNHCGQFHYLTVGIGAFLIGIEQRIDCRLQERRTAAPHERVAAQANGPSKTAPARF